MGKIILLLTKIYWNNKKQRSKLKQHLTPTLTSFQVQLHSFIPKLLYHYYPKRCSRDGEQGP